MQLSRLLEDLISARNQNTVAGDIGVDPSCLSRFRSGESGLKAEALDALFNVLDLVVIPRKEKDQLEETIIMLTQKWDQARRG